MAARSRITFFEFKEAEKVFCSNILLSIFQVSSLSFDEELLLPEKTAAYIVCARV